MNYFPALNASASVHSFYDSSVKILASWRNHTVEFFSKLPVQMAQSHRVAVSVFLCANVAFYKLTSAIIGFLEWSIADQSLNSEQKSLKQCLLNSALTGGLTGGLNYGLSRLTRYPLSLPTLCAISCTHVALRCLFDNASVLYYAPTLKLMKAAHIQEMNKRKESAEAEVQTIIEQELAKSPVKFNDKELGIFNELKDNTLKNINAHFKDFDEKFQEIIKNIASKNDLKKFSEQNQAMNESSKSEISVLIDDLKSECSQIQQIAAVREKQESLAKIESAIQETMFIQNQKELQELCAKLQAENPTYRDKLADVLTESLSALQKLDISQTNDISECTKSAKIKLYHVIPEKAHHWTNLWGLLNKK